eukprot:11164462-Lingulodinium_polyedra.AAC.1
MRPAVADLNHDSDLPEDCDGPATPEPGVRIDLNPTLNHVSSQTDSSSSHFGSVRHRLQQSKEDLEASRAA